MAIIGNIPHFQTNPQSLVYKSHFQFHDYRYKTHAIASWNIDPHFSSFFGQLQFPCFTSAHLAGGDGHPTAPGGVGREGRWGGEERSSLQWLGVWWRGDGWSKGFGCWVMLGCGEKWLCKFFFDFWLDVCWCLLMSVDSQRFPAISTWRPVGQVFCVSMPSCRSRRRHSEQELIRNLTCSLMNLGFCVFIVPTHALKRSPWQFPL